jgi:hypothetical protein
MADAWRWLVALLALVAAIWFSASSLSEAYGAGPPYHSRSTNMDKWESPVPMVVGVDVAALAFAALLLAPALRRAKSARAA